MRNFLSLTGRSALLSSAGSLALLALWPLQAQTALQPGQPAPSVTVPLAPAPLAAAQPAPTSSVTVPLPPATPVSPISPAPVRLNNSGRTIDLVVPLRERVPLGQVAIRLLPDDKISVSRSDLVAALSRATTPAFRDSISALPNSEGYVDIDALRALGLTLRFDPAALDLLASIDTSAQPERDLNLGFGGEGSDVLPDSSSPFGAYLAYQTSLDYGWRGFERGLRRPVAAFDLNGRLFNLVSFENTFSYDGNRDREFTRFGSRLIHDRPNSLLRFQGGDLFSVPRLFQDQADIAGIGVSKLLTELRPDRVFTASAGRRLTLNEPALVTILVNGAPARTLRLAAGNYDLQDLPLTGGANDIQLLIEDEAGGRRVIAFDFFLDTDLLGANIDEFDATLGIRSDLDDSRRRYFGDEPIFSGFYRRGLTEQLTGGGNLQLTRDAQQGGIEAVVGTKIGLFAANASASRIDAVGTGMAARLQYRYSTPLAQQLGARRIDFAAEYRSSRFGGVDNLVPANPFSWSLTGRYSQPLSQRLTVGLGADWQRGRGLNSDRYAIRATAGYNFSNGIQINASTGYDRRSGTILGLNLFWRIGRSGLATAQYDRQLDDARIGYFHSPERPIDAVAWSVEASRSNGISGLDGTAVWRTNRGDFELAQRAALTAPEGGEREVRTALRARGALAFADGQFAAGRYLSGGFAIVSPHRSLGGAEVEIGNRITGSVQARSGALGPALVPVSPYSQQTIYYNVPNAPDGYDLGSGSSTFFTWLHGGNRAVVGSEFNVTAVGRLLDDRGEPLALVAATARRIGDEASPSVAIFTNRVGRLGATGLAPGRWRLNAGRFTYEFVIEEKQGSLVDLSTLRPIEVR